MTTITLEVPDDLATQLNRLSGSLPDLLREVVKDRLARGSSLQTQPIWQELIDFLHSNPEPQQIIAFKISPAAQERLEEMLEKNRENSLTADERAELDIYLHLSHLVTRLKARARSERQNFDHPAHPDNV